jgi:beta-N-acetylhexosaminidase
MNDYDINKLTIDEKIGQLIMFGFDALEVNNHAINLIKNYRAGNVILFTRNVKSMEQVHTLTKNLQKLALENIGIPLLISIDQEGGMVTRLRNGGTFFPGAMTITASDDSNNAYLSGKHMGQELKSLGLNIDLAPVLDVNNNPQNPVIGVRSFSDNPEVVSEYGTKFIKGLQENVIATAKHFPGHGDTQLDSHLALPTISYDRYRLENVELYPFKKAINDGVKAIMSAHINFPAYTEDNLPTTLSKKCLTGLLRDQLKFEGLIMTDCMEMKAIQDNYTTEKGSLMAVQAGANLLCLSHQENLQIGAINKIKEAVSSGELSEEDLNERVLRVLKYKEELDTIDFTEKYSEVENIVENKKTKEMSYNIVRNGGTLIRGKQFMKKGKTLVIAVKPTTTTIADEADGSYDIITVVKQKLPQFDTLEIHSRVSKQSIKEAVELSKDYDQVVVCTYNGNIYRAQLDLVKEMSEEDIELHVIAMRNPYDLLNESQIKNYVCFYEYTPNSVKVLIEYLKGELILRGKVPITYE